MKRSVVETILGAVVLAVAGLFLAFSYKQANIGSPDGYHVTADFSGTGGLNIGDDVMISGVKVGQVTAINLVPENYQARVHMSLDQNVKLPSDTGAIISSESIMGGRYLALEPGAEEDMIPDGGRVQFTQAPQNLEQLLGKFIFSVQDSKKGGSESAESNAGGAFAD